MAVCDIQVQMGSGQRQMSATLPEIAQSAFLRVHPPMNAKLWTSPDGSLFKPLLEMPSNTVLAVARIILLKVAK